MSGVCRIVLLFSILLRPNVCQGRRPAEQEEPVERSSERGPLVALLCVLLLLLFLLVVGFCILYYILLSEVNCDEGDGLAFLEQGSEEGDSEWGQPPEEEEEQELEPFSMEPPDAGPTQVCITHLYQSQSTERFHCDEAGTSYFQEEFQSFTGSSLSLSQASPEGEDRGGDQSSDTTLYFEICHEM